MTHKDIQLPVATGVTDGPALRAEYERGFIDGMQEQMRRSVDRAVNAMVPRWVGLTDDEIDQGLLRSDYALQTAHAWRAGVVFAMAQLKEKNT